MAPFGPPEGRRRPPRWAAVSAAASEDGCSIPVGAPRTCLEHARYEEVRKEVVEFLVRLRLQSELAEKGIGLRVVGATVDPVLEDFDCGIWHVIEVVVRHERPPLRGVVREREIEEAFARYEDVPRAPGTVRYVASLPLPAHVEASAVVPGAGLRKSLRRLRVPVGHEA